MNRTESPAPLLLAVEASTRTASVALWQEGVLSDEITQSDPTVHHSEILLPMAKEILNRNALGWDHLQTLVVSRGPGSFTSVRIALATVLGLAFPHRLPTYALSTLEVMAWEMAQTPAPFLLPMLDARKGEVYAALYQATPDDLRPILAPGVWPAGDLIRQLEEHRIFQSSVVAAGEGARAYSREIQDSPVILEHRENPQTPGAGALVRRAWQRIRAGIASDTTAPLYLRRPEAVVHLKDPQEGTEEESPRFCFDFSNLS